MDEMELDYNKYMTLSNLSKAIFTERGCYDGECQLRGKTALFIRKCVIGGRTMASLHNKKDYGLHILNEMEGEEDQEGFNYNYEDNTINPKYDTDGNCFAFKSYGDFNVIIKKRNIKKTERKNPLLEGKNNNFISPRPLLKPGEKKKKIYCLDANSLYPSAIVRLKGYPLGKPKNIPKEDLDNKNLWNMRTNII